MSLPVSAAEIPTPLTALSQGPALMLSEDHPAHLAQALERAAKLFPENGVSYLDARGQVERQTYPQLLEEAMRVAAGLAATGAQPGETVIFQLEANRDFITAFWACQLSGLVPVPVSISPTYEQAHSVLAKLRNVWEMLGHPRIVASDTLAARVQAFALREKLDGMQVLSAGALRKGGANPAVRPDSDDVALLLLTSGSTGKPKAVRQTHRSLLAWAASVAASCQFDDRDVSINWMPLDHVGGLVMFHLRDVVAGCNQFHAPTEAVLQQPLRWLDWIERFRATITWAPNFAFGLVNEVAEQIGAARRDLSSMRFILNGGEAIVSKTARRFIELLLPHGLPPTAMRPAWGMSETSSGVTYNHAFTLASTSDDDLFVNVGKPIAGVALRIVDSSDHPQPEGKIGRLQIKGVSITEGYHDNPEANKAAFTRDGWFITGDLGIIRNGNLTITGREKDVIIINGVNFYSHEIEAIAEEVPGLEVSFTAACAVRKPNENTDKLALFFCPRPESNVPALVEMLRAQVAKKGGVSPDYIVPLNKDDVPKTAIGKIQRSILRERFENGQLASCAVGTSNAGNGHPIHQKTWRAAPLDARPLPTGACALVLADEGQLSDLRSELHRAGASVIAVRTGDAFAKSGEEFVLDPNRFDDFQALFANLMSKQRTITHVVHGWSCEPTSESSWPNVQTAPRRETSVGKASDSSRHASLFEAQSRGACALLRLLQAWPNPPDDRAPVRLIATVRNILAVTPGEIVRPEHGSLCGILTTLPHELGWVEPTLLDLGDANGVASAQAIIAELSATATNEVAVRDGSRYLPTLENAPALTAAEHSFARPGSFIVLTGGLGGIGRQLIPYLFSRYDARILSLGRTQVDNLSDESKDFIDQAGERLRYAAGDLADLRFVEGAILEATKAFGRTPEVALHLAAEYHEKELLAETAEGLLLSLQAKARVGAVLEAAVQAFDSCTTVHFSSLLGEFGALGTGAYAAANTALDAVCAEARSRGRRSYNLLWSLWTGTGMGRGTSSDAMKARGFLSLSVDKAIALMELSTRLPPNRYLIGLDAENALMQRRLGISVAAVASVHISPRNPNEAKLARIWQEVLSRPEIGVTENFFEIGGRSLLAARIFAHIEKEFGKSLPLSTLFQAPTIETLAQLLTRDSATAPACTVLPLRKSGARTPIFCVPGGGSDAIVFQDFAQALGDDQPVYGLQARGLDATPVEGEFPSVEQVAKDFIAEIKKAQPHGPYVLAGHCFGCLLIWETARQMQASGEVVQTVVLIDPIVSNVFSGEILGRDRLRYHFGRFLRMPLRQKVDYFAEKIRNFSRTLIVRQRISHSYDQARDMHSRYQLGNYSGAVVVALARDSFYRIAPKRDPRRHYETLLDRPVDYFEVEGDHHSMLHFPGIGELAENVRRRLAVSSNHAILDARVNRP
ncbi:MAG TPA: alpha/beta fold hydrolase [Opitutaceae bacterium]|nr:alpha/beta fold hydrolase [Opitutaceae bacterium]